MNYLFAIVVASFVGLLSMDQALAAEIRNGERVHIPAATTIEEDLYVFGQEVVIDGVIRGDLVTAASTIQINGQVEGNLIAAGKDVRILGTGTIGRTARLAGANVQIEGQIQRDLFAACGDCRLGDSAKVAVDLFTAGGELNLAGAVGRGMKIAGNRVRLLGKGGGTAEVRAGRLFVEPSASLPSLIYGSQEPATLSPEAKIGRIETRSEWVPKKPNPLWGNLFGALVALVTGSLLFWFSPTRSAEVAQTLRTHFPAALLWGLLVALIAPLAIVIVMATVVGLPLAVLAAGIYGFGLYFGYLASARAVGELIGKGTKQSLHPVLALAVGLVLLALLGMIPFVGGMVRALSTLAGFGAFWLMFTDSRWFASHFHKATTSQ